MSSTAVRADALRLELARRGLSQAEFAALAGVTEATVSHAATGRRVSMGTVRKLAKALAMTPALAGADALFCGPQAA